MLSEQDAESCDATLEKSLIQHAQILQGQTIYMSDIDNWARYVLHEAMLGHKLASAVSTAYLRRL